MKKTLMIAATALALGVGVATLQSNSAQAGGYGYGGSYGGGYHGGGYGGGYGGSYDYHGGCYTKYKRIRIKVHGYYGLHWKWIRKPIKICY